MSFDWCFKFAGGVAVGGLLLLTFAEMPAQQPTTPDNVFMKPIHAGDKAKIAPQPKPPQALSMPNANQLTRLDEAYLDVFSILKEDSACSAFYGGPSAILVLNRLKQQLKPVHLELDSTLGLRMSGKTITITSFPYRLTFRLFAKAQLNLAGPFYRVSAAHPHRTIGRFRPNTREARVTILLHELGHLIEGPGKQWLLPDDGGDRHLSEENTERVIAACGKQIRCLRRITLLRNYRLRGAPCSPANETNLFAP